LVGERAVRGIRFQVPLGLRELDRLPTYGNDWFASAEALALWSEAASLGIPVCVHFMRGNREKGLAELKKIAEQFPAAAVVVDHVSNFAFEEGPPGYGLDAPLAALAALPNVYVKLVTINLARLAAANLPPGPAVARVAETFGAHRIMWGSDVGQSKEPYSEMVSLAREAVASFSRADKNAILGGTAERLYF
jgi:predicted TIM-barrel fold metal-dependent hydrolase